MHPYAGKHTGSFPPKYDCNSSTYGSWWNKKMLYIFTDPYGPSCQVLTHMGTEISRLTSFKLLPAFAKVLGSKVDKKLSLTAFLEEVSATLNVKNRMKLLGKLNLLWITGKMLNMTQAFISKIL